MAIKIASPKTPTLDALPAAVVPDVSVIREHYPNIGNKISALWGSVQLHNFLNQIIIDDRGDRQGFPPPIVSALLRIYQYHTTLVPQAIPPADTWDHVL